MNGDRIEQKVTVYKVYWINPNGTFKKFIDVVEDITKAALVIEKHKTQLWERISNSTRQEVEDFHYEVIETEVQL